VYTPHGGGGDRFPEANGSGSDPGAVEYYASAVAGLVATGLLVAAFYPTLVAMTAPLELFSSTVIVFVLVLVWVVLWSGVELVWTWGSRRAGGSE
jgi:hypothetical protein